MSSDPAVPATLYGWLRDLGRATIAVEALPGDVSARRYYRVHLPGGSAIAAHYPIEVAGVCGRFLRTSALLHDAGVRAPAILESDCEAGWMLVEDLGPQTLYDHAGAAWPQLEAALGAALEVVPRIAALDRELVASLSPPLDGDALRRELRQTWDLLFAPLGVEDEPGLGSALSAALDALCAGLGAAPLVPCHRDLMARNLVPTGAWPTTSLAVLDHQDLRLGPATYDVASLLNDSLFPDTAAEARLLARLGLDRPADPHAYPRAVVQRTLKAVGTFLAFARRGARRHLPLVRPTLARAERHLSGLPETAELAPALGALWREERLGVLLH